jgi:hypothetical protein
VLLVGVLLVGVLLPLAPIGHPRFFPDFLLGWPTFPLVTVKRTAG